MSMNQLSVLCVMIQEYTQVESTSTEQVPIQTNQDTSATLNPDE